MKKRILESDATVVKNVAVVEHVPILPPHLRHPLPVEAVTQVDLVSAAEVVIVVLVTVREREKEGERSVDEVSVVVLAPVVEVTLHGRVEVTAVAVAVAVTVTVTPLLRVAVLRADDHRPFAAITDAVVIVAGQDLHPRHPYKSDQVSQEAAPVEVTLVVKEDIIDLIHLIEDLAVIVATVDQERENLSLEVLVAIDMSRHEQSIVALALQEVAVDLRLSVHEIRPNRNVVIVDLFHTVQDAILLDLSHAVQSVITIGLSHAVQDVVDLDLVVQEIHLDQPNEAIVDLHHAVQDVADLCLAFQEIHLDQNAVAVNPLHRVVQDLAVDRDLAVIQVGGSSYGIILWMFFE